ncbi:MAG: hypothetical protein Q9M30_09180, partial [Mariprofundaceae bacterium]|nr:hypothetical protein [Mariprofundaceae bacterium]
DSLVQELIKSALEPVIADRLQAQPHDQRKAILSIRVCDPASGSGHFLLAAARRLAAELARIDAGADQPTEADYRHAMREVVAHCIYGVDINPLAVELCRTALWLETVEPGKPLGFLDARIRCGNSLVGVLDPDLLKDGIPANAFKALTGDDKPIVAQLKKDNRATSDSVQGDLFGGDSLDEAELEIELVDEMPENTPEQIAEKRTAWLEAQQSASVRRERLKFDTFTAAFFAPKTATTRNTVPVNQDLARLRQGLPLDAAKESMVKGLAKQHRFFHWHLAFPEVFEKGGFDCVLGNPPWEVSQLDEKEYFSVWAPSLSTLSGSHRKKAMVELENERPDIWRQYEMDKHSIESANNFFRASNRFPLTSSGKVNLYSLFAEHSMQAISSEGRIGIILTSGIASDKPSQKFFQFIVDQGRLISIASFENEEFIFKGIHHSTRFSLVTLIGKRGGIQNPIYKFFLRKIDDIKDERRSFSLTGREINLINPNTKLCPVFRSKHDANITISLYRSSGVLIRDGEKNDGNPWDLILLQNPISSSSDKELLQTYSELDQRGAERIGSTFIVDHKEFVPLIEGRMIHQYNHRFASYEGLVERPSNAPIPEVTFDQLCQPSYVTVPWYWVPKDEMEKRLLSKGWKHQWIIGWRDITSAHVLRTLISSVIPRVGSGDTFSLVLPNSESMSPKLISSLLGNLNSLPLDFVARQKVGG